MSLETISYRGYTIEVEYDDMPDSPAGYGFEVVENHEKYYTESGKIRPEIQAKMRAGKMFLVDKYEHGNVIYRLAGQSVDRWDTSRNWGWIIFDDDYAQNFHTLEGRRIMAESDLETYTDWANGSVYGFNITNPYGEALDDGSLWGIYGFEYAINEAKMVVDSDIKNDKPARHAPRAQELHR